MNRDTLAGEAQGRGIPVAWEISELQGKCKAPVAEPCEYQGRASIPGSGDMRVAGQA